jgi:hypothetical protein
MSRADKLFVNFAQKAAQLFVASANRIFFELIDSKMQLWYILSE